MATARRRTNEALAAGGRAKKSALQSGSWLSAHPNHNIPPHLAPALQTPPPTSQTLRAPPHAYVAAMGDKSVRRTKTKRDSVIDVFESGQQGIAAKVCHCGQRSGRGVAGGHDPRGWCSCRR